MTAGCPYGSAFEYPPPSLRLASEVCELAELPVRRRPPYCLDFIQKANETAVKGYKTMKACAELSDKTIWNFKFCSPRALCKRGCLVCDHIPAMNAVQLVGAEIFRSYKEYNRIAETVLCTLSHVLNSKEQKRLRKFRALFEALCVVFIEIRIQRRLDCAVKHKDNCQAANCKICLRIGIGSKNLELKRMAWEILLQNNHFQRITLIDDDVYEIHTGIGWLDFSVKGGYHWLKEIYAIAGECSLMGNVNGYPDPTKLPAPHEIMSESNQKPKYSCACYVLGEWVNACNFTLDALMNYMKGVSVLDKNNTIFGLTLGNIGFQHPPGWTRKGSHFCAYCYTEETEIGRRKFKACRQCKVDEVYAKHFYCSKKCHEADWSYHKWFHEFYANV